MVRNNKIIPGLRRGAGWNVIKVIWGQRLRRARSRRRTGELVKRRRVVDGDIRNTPSRPANTQREHFFNTPRLQELSMSNEDIADASRQATHSKVICNTRQPRRA